MRKVPTGRKSRASCCVLIGVARPPIMRHALAVIKASGPRALAVAHRRDGRLVPMKVRPNVDASLAAGLAHEARFQTREPNGIRPRSALIAIKWLQR